MHPPTSLGDDTIGGQMQQMILQQMQQRQLAFFQMQQQQHQQQQQLYRPDDDAGGRGGGVNSSGMIAWQLPPTMPTTAGTRRENTAHGGIPGGIVPHLPPHPETLLLQSHFPRGGADDAAANDFSGFDYFKSSTMFNGLSRNQLRQLRYPYMMPALDAGALPAAAAGGTASYGFPSLALHQGSGGGSNGAGRQGQGRGAYGDSSLDDAEAAAASAVMSAQLASAIERLRMQAGE